MKRTWIIAGGIAAAALAAVFFVRPEPAAAVSGERLEIVGSGKIWHYHGPVNPGDKTFINKVKPAGLIECIQGAPTQNGGSCTSAGLATDPGGKAYIWVDGPRNWRVGTNPSGADATTLNGFIGGKGEFWFTGNHGPSNTTIIASGKAKFEKGTLSVKKLKGKIIAIGLDGEHPGTGNFRSVGKPVGPPIMTK